MEKFRIFLSSILAGMAIAIGGIANLTLENKVAGAIFFTAGLFTVCVFGFHLFTGKVCYVFENKAGYIIDLAVIWLGNLAGAVITGFLILQTRISGINEKAITMVSGKLSQNPLSVFILGIFCNIMIYIAVEGYRSCKHEIGKYLAIFFGVTVFVLCGFEHCVANMFYLTMANAWDQKALLFLLINTAGNIVGGMLIPGIRLVINKDKT
ncbi:MAG: formate/nitrite transporter family protein [Lachnospiraceae bacterium]|nr:formate/nitrite transporter family protein [Lachnospiraceae bacterium]MBQ3902489.1 formate/nitrite transporter family protein [Lachnospiraceae bacterium]MCR5212366.1 formate/nitrite transporter family protein [Lachnospiraceae bacterium]